MELPPSSIRLKPPVSWWPGAPSLSRGLLRPFSSVTHPSPIPESYPKGWEAMRKNVESTGRWAEGGGTGDSNVRGRGCEIGGAAKPLVGKVVVRPGCPSASAGEL